jgi:multicomponent K+:H+ antiporter subunit E
MTTPNLPSPPSRVAFPAPIVSICVGLAWLLINNTLFIGHILLALVLAWLLPFAFLQGDASVPLRRPLTFARLMVIVLYDIVVSNIQVARLILGREARIRPQFVWIPLDLQSDAGKLWLAGIITMTPGTVSALFSDDRTHLLIHTLDVDDPKALVDGIKSRYEAVLLEVFG